MEHGEERQEDHGDGRCAIAAEKCPAPDNEGSHAEKATEADGHDDWLPQDEKPATEQEKPQGVSEPLDPFSHVENRAVSMQEVVRVSGGDVGVVRNPAVVEYE